RKTLPDVDRSARRGKSRSNLKAEKLGAKADSKADRKAAKAAKAEAKQERKLAKREAKAGRGSRLPWWRGKADDANGNGNGGGNGAVIPIPPPPGAAGQGGGGWNGPPVGVATLPTPEPPRAKPRIKKLRILFIVLGLGLLGMASAFFGMVMAVSQDLPAIEKYAQYKAAKNTVVTDSQGEVIGTLSSNQNRMLLRPEQISPNMKNAVVAIEDSRFYEHRGIDFRGLGRALVQDVIARSAKQGASTITQQLVKQALEASNDRTVFQKVREMSLAYHIEQEWTKDKILTEYLNTVYFGAGAYGIEAAARTYFGKAHPSCGTEDAPCAELLTPAEAGLLAGVIQNPWGYDPKNDPDAALFRRNIVLGKMFDQGYITSTQYRDATAEALPAESDIKVPSLDSKAPYYTSWVRQQLVDRFGAGRTFFGGLKVKTSLDLEVQAATQDAVDSTLGGVGPTASVVVINNKDATIDAMIAGPDYDTAPFNLATQGYRQPGSTIKPFVLTTALEQGISPYSVFTSAKQVFNFKNQEPFEVNNYGDSYLGAIDLVTATVNSDNSVYAQLGLEAIKGGPKAIARTIHKMGVTDKIPTNPAMVLGTSEVTPLQWTYAFSTLANDGRRVSGSLAPDPGDSPVAYTKVTDERGKTIKGGQNEVQSTGVISPETAATAKGILHQVVTSGTGKNANVGDESQWGKTGTTENNSNAWFCGAITEVTACVWVGYAEGYKEMLTEYAGSPVDGGTYPAIIWARVIEAWKEIEEARAAERAAKAAEEESDEDSTGDTSTELPESTDTYVPEQTAPAPEVTEPAPAPE
ncbi:MAG: transglycosylase domain-containing protein, partial [Actinomycetota bacterium]|nr:transglycosylase domain-containing protein [Actinomycetota bacterium]